MEIEKANFRLIENDRLEKDCCSTCQKFDKRVYFFDYCKKFLFHFDLNLRSPFYSVCDCYKRVEVSI